MMRFLKAMTLAMALAVIAALPGKAKATLIGDEVTLEVFANGMSFLGPFTETVGAGSEFNVVDLITVDVGASSIEFTIIDGGPGVVFGVDADFVLTDLDWIGETGSIVDVILDPIAGFGSVSFTEDSVTFSVLEDSPFVLGPLASIELVTRRASVPEPGTLALLGLGLAGFGFTRRRFKQAA